MAGRGIGDLDQNHESVRRNNLAKRCRKAFSAVELSYQKMQEVVLGIGRNGRGCDVTAETVLLG